jgi:hypothetical protein
MFLIALSAGRVNSTEVTFGHVILGAVSSLL